MVCILHGCRVVPPAWAASVLAEASMVTVGGNVVAESFKADPAVVSRDPAAAVGVCLVLVRVPSQLTRPDTLVTTGRPLREIRLVRLLSYQAALDIARSSTL